MAVSQKLLDILVCPETKQSLKLVDEESIRNLNQKIKAGALKNRAGKDVQEEIDGALLREDQKVMYLVREDIPIMLIEEGVEV